MDDAIGTFGTVIAISPPAVRHTPDHPPYAEMIQSAIRSLAEEEGSTFSAIDDYIKANYHDLPWGHPNLYPHYLRKLLHARELFLSPSGRFLLSDPHLPPPDFPTPPPHTPKRRWAGHPRTDSQIRCSITGRFVKLGAVAPTRMRKRRRKRGRPKFFKGAISNRRARAAVGTSRISLARDVEPLQIAGEEGSQMQPHSGSTLSNTMPKRKRGRPRLYEATSSSRSVRAAAKMGATGRRRKRGRSRFSMATFRSRKVRAAVATGVSPVEEVEPLQIAVEGGGGLSEPDAGSKRGATVRRRKRGRSRFSMATFRSRKVRAAVTTGVSPVEEVEPLQIAVEEGGGLSDPDAGSKRGATVRRRKRGRSRFSMATFRSRKVRAAVTTGVSPVEEIEPLQIAVEEGGGLSEPDAGSKRGATVRRRKRGRSRFSMATFRSRKVRAAVTTGVSPVEEVEPLQIAVEGGPLEPDADSKRRDTLPKRKRGRPKLFMSTIRSRKLQDAAESGVSPMKDVEPLQVAVEEGGPSEPDVGLKLRAMMSKCRRGLPRLFTETVGSRIVRAAAMIGVSLVKDIEPLQIAVEAGGSSTPTQLGKYVSSDGADHVPSTSTDVFVTEVPLGFTTPLSEVHQNINSAHDEAAPSSNLVDAVDGIMTGITLALPSPTCPSNPPSRTPLPRKRGRPVKKSGPKASLKKSSSIQVSHSHFVDSSLVPADNSQLENTNEVHSNDGIVKLPVNLSAHMPELTDTTNDRAVMPPLEVEASESVVGHVVFSEKYDSYSIDDHGGGTIPLEMDVSQFAVDNAVGSGNNEAHTISDFGAALPLERKASESLVDNVVGSEKPEAQSTSEFGGGTSPSEIEASESLVDNADVQTPSDLGGVTLPLEIDAPESWVDNAVGSEKEGQYELPNLIEEEVPQLPEAADTDGECGEPLRLERKSPESEDKYVNSNKQPPELTNEGITQRPEVADTDGEHGGLLHLERKFSLSESEDKHVSSNKQPPELPNEGITQRPEDTDGELLHLERNFSLSESEGKHVSSQKHKAGGSPPEHRPEPPKVIDEGITQTPGVADTDSEHGVLLPLDRKTPESDKRANSKKRKSRWTPPEHRPEPPKLRPRVTKQ